MRIRSVIHVTLTFFLLALATAWGVTDALAEEVAVTRDPFALPPLLREAIQKRLDAMNPMPNDVKPDGSATPIVLPEVKPPALTVQGIFLGGERPCALINRRIVCAGETIEEVRIVAVTEEGVTVSFGGREFAYKIPAGREKKDETFSKGGSTP